jgi:carboxyl-terminal processing protease
LENERKQQEETAKMRNDDYQLSYALDVLKGLATLSQN